MELLESGILRRALLEVVILGLACGPLGVWILHFRHAYAAESLAHAMLPGLVLAALAGAPLVLGATGGVLAAAALVGLAARDRRVGGELAVAVTVTGLFGLGAILAAAPGAPARVGDLLFGDPLGVTTADLVAAVVLCAGVLAALAAGARSLRAVAFDPVGAPSLGLRAGRVEPALLAVLGIALVAAVQGLGNLLVLALLVAPATAAMRASDRLGTQLRLAAGLGAVAGAAGLELSRALDVAAGPAIALVACLLPVVTALVRGRQGEGAAAGRTGGSPVEALTRPPA